MGFSYRYRYFPVKYRWYWYRYRYFPLLVYRRQGSSKAAADGRPTMHWNSQGLMRRLVGRPVEPNREPRRADRANCLLLLVYRRQGSSKATEDWIPVPEV